MAFLAVQETLTPILRFGTVNCHQRITYIYQGQLYLPDVLRLRNWSAELNNLKKIAKRSRKWHCILWSFPLSHAAVVAVTPLCFSHWNLTLIFMVHSSITLSLCRFIHFILFAFSFAFLFLFNFRLDSYLTFKCLFSALGFFSYFIQ